MSRISRRSFLATGAAAAVLPAFPKNLDGGKRPNILILHTDQQANWTLGVYGGKLIGTPNLDSIGREGAVLTSFFTNAAVCTPSRGCFMTGLYPSSHGASFNEKPLRAEVETFAHVLAAAGWDTGYAGKWHLSNDGKPGLVSDANAMGWQDHRAMWNRGHYKVAKAGPDGRPTFPSRENDGVGDESSYTTDYLAGRAIEFITQSRKNPFCFMVSFPDPHTPFSVRAPYRDLFKPEGMPLPDSFQDATAARVEGSGEDASDELGGGKKGKTRGGHNAQVSAEFVKKSKALYCGMVKCIDDNVGRILKALRDCGHLDDTIIIHTSDHGEMMGEHGRMHKGVPYQTAYRVPFLIRYPKRIKPASVIDGMMATVDFKPTLLGFLGLTGKQRDEGCDLSGMLTGASDGADGVAHIQYLAREDGGHVGLITPRHLLAFVYQKNAVDPSQTFFYDRIADPEFRHPLKGSEEWKTLVPGMLARMKAKHAEIKGPQAAVLQSIAV